MRKRLFSRIATLAVLAVTMGAASQADAQSAVPPQLAGQWTSRQNGTYTVIVLQPDGHYTATAVSGGGAYRITSWGHWRLNGSYLRFYVQNYSPRRYLGRPIYFPRTWGATLRYVGRDRFVTAAGEVYYRSSGYSAGHAENSITPLPRL